MGAAVLARVLGEVFWSAGVPSLSDAHRMASARMAQGRPAVSWVDSEGHAWCAWGVAS